MSYQHTHYGWITVCDICQEFGPIGDRYLRTTPQSTTTQPIHLCNRCRCQAVWCASHHTYHLAESFHRHACIDCGGLFTSIARDQLSQCRSCRQTTASSAPQQQPRLERHILVSVTSWLAQALQF